MADHRVHVQGKQDAAPNRVLMPQAGNMEFVACQELLHQPDQLNSQILLVAGEGIGALHIELARCPKNQVLQAEFLDRLFQVDLAYLR